MGEILPCFGNSDPLPHAWGVGMPAFLRLHAFGRVIYETFGRYPLLVGSALEEKKAARDIDVRLVLMRDDYAVKVGPIEHCYHPLGAWAHLCYAFSLVGRDMTGLPVDFQIQDTSRAMVYADRPRLLLGMGHQGDAVRRTGDTLMPKLSWRQEPLGGPNDPGAHDPEAREWPDAMLVQGRDPGAEHRAKVRLLNAQRQQGDEEARRRHAASTVAGQLLGSLAATAARERKRRDGDTPRPG